MFGFWNCCGDVSAKLSTVELIIQKYSPENRFVSEAEYQGSMTWVHIQNYLTGASKSSKNHSFAELTHKTKWFSFRKISTSRIDLVIILLHE